MYGRLAISALLASCVSAKVVPREGLSTLTIVLPTQAQPFTSTVKACSDVSAFAVVGVPTGEFRPGTTTIYGPPQADPASTTIVDTVSNATAVYIFSKLQGECAAFSVPPPEPTTAKLTTTPVTPTFTSSSTASATAEVCPENGCQAKVIRSAQTVIDAINQVTLISQNLQAAAKRIAEKPAKRDLAAVQAPFDDVANGLKSISVTLSVTIPRITFIPAFPPGCDTDAIVIALIQFVRVHQALLNIIIGQRGLLEQSPIKREVTEFHKGSDENGDVSSEGAIIGPAIAAGLRAVEGVVDALAFQILRLVPTRSECAKQQKEAIDGSLGEAIFQYEN